MWLGTGERTHAVPVSLTRRNSMAITRAAVLVGILLGSPSLPGAQARAQTPITLEQALADEDWIGSPVTAAWWSADGGRVFYRLGAPGSRETGTYRVDPATGQSARVEAANLALIDEADQVFDRERRQAVFSRAGDLFLRRIASGELVRLTEGPEEESSPMFSPDGGRVLFERGADWFAWAPGAAITPVLQLTPGGSPATGTGADSTAVVDLGEKVEVLSSALSPDGLHALAVTRPKNYDRGRPTQMPNYLPESGYPELVPLSPRVGRNPRPPETLWRVDVAARRAQPLDLSGLPGIDRDPLADLRRAQKLPPLQGQRPVEVGRIVWSADGREVAVALRANDGKDLWLIGVDPGSGRVSLRHRESDPAWASPMLLGAFGFLPDNALWFLSEQGGHHGLYLHEGGETRTVVAGAFDVLNVQWNRAGTRAFFMGNRERPVNYELCRVNRDGSGLRELTALEGIGTRFGDVTHVLSPDDRQLAVRYTGHYLPPQLALVDAQTGVTRRLTDTRSAAFAARTWIEPELLAVPSSHGAGQVWAKLFTPVGGGAGRRYPIVVYAHGGPPLQQVGPWMDARRSLFHHFLAQQGYLVVEVDFRGSSGYGRAFRNAVYRQLGHRETEDLRDAVDFLVANRQGDRDRVGIYGQSYGGFLAPMAMFLAPEVFKAGAGVSGPSDPALAPADGGGTVFLNAPDVDPEAFRASSLLEYAPNFRGHLLIAHGMVDPVVPYEHSVRLVQRLIELGKENWEFATYPKENHFFLQGDSRLDLYRRIYRLFERTLKANP